ncbi:MAG TPA: tetratricopeptide repeat protein [Terriglobia bacterium]|nr:tetratricopeptide repeat protein [Terriglobia bacterium]
MDGRSGHHSGTGRLTIVAFLGLAMLLLAPSACQGSDDSIEGQIRVTTGEPLPPGVTVRLEVAEKIVVDQQLVGATGKFAFYNLKDQSYEIIVTADGFQPATSMVDMHYLASRFPTIYLIPLPPKKATPPPTESTTDLGAPKKARKEFEKGYSALSVKDLGSAQEHLEKAVNQDPCYARALTALGMVFSLKHDFPAAESSFKKSIQCDGGFLDAYIQMQTLLDSEKKYAECESIMQEGLRVAPGEWQLHYGLGIEHHHLGKYPQAAEEYLKAESLSPAVPPDIHFRLADAYLELKEYDEAYVEMQNYLQVDPNGPFAVQTRALLPSVDSMRKSKGQPLKDAQ